MAKRTVRKRANAEHPNILLFAIDSLLADHMSCYGYSRLTTPHMDRIASQGALFERTYSAHIPTTPGYSSMLTGRDCFGTEVVALRHQGPLTPKVKTLAEICRQAGYNTSCVGFQWNAGGRGFDKYLDFAGWGLLQYRFDQGPEPQRGDPAGDRLPLQGGQALVHDAPAHGPALALPAARAL